MKVRIGLIGCGVVGTGIVHLLAQNGERIAQRDGVELEIAKILVGNKDKPRKGVDPALVTDRLEDLLEDESISMVLELSLIHILSNSTTPSASRSYGASPTAPITTSKPMPRKAARRWST